MATNLMSIIISVCNADVVIGVNLKQSLKRIMPHLVKKSSSENALRGKKQEYLLEFSTAEWAENSAGKEEAYEKIGNCNAKDDHRWC